MILVTVAALLAAPAVPTPRDYPKGDFVGGPLSGLMAELRGEKTQPPSKEVSALIEQLFELGQGRSIPDLASLVSSSAVQSFESPTFPDTSWSGKIKSGFLSKFDGCVHTAPWFDGTVGQTQKVHFYWSCDKNNPYVLRTDIRLSNGRVESWKASELPHPLVLNSNQRVSN